MDQNTLDFYNANKDKSWKLPAIPDNLKTNYDIARWIFTQNIGWIKMDIEIDLDSWKKDTENIYDYLVPHRDEESKGWNSCCIHGLGIDKTENSVAYGYHDETTAPYSWTELAEQVPHVVNFFKNVFPCDNYKRIRFMELSPNGYIGEHGDIPDDVVETADIDPMDFGIPLNIAIVHPDDCYMPFKNKGILPYKEGQLYIPNVAEKHAFLNFSNDNRIHIIADCIPGSKKEQYAELLVRSYRKQFDAQ
jgi:hypothetical protein